MITFVGFAIDDGLDTTTYYQYACEKDEALIICCRETAEKICSENYYHQFSSHYYHFQNKSSWLKLPEDWKKVLKLTAPKNIENFHNEKSTEIYYQEK